MLRHAYVVDGAYGGLNTDFSLSAAESPEIMLPHKQPCRAVHCRYVGLARVMVGELLQKHIPLRLSAYQIDILFAFRAVSRVKILLRILAGQYRDISRQQSVHALYKALTGDRAVNMHVEAEAPRVNARVRPRAAVNGRRGYLKQLPQRFLQNLLHGKRVVLPLKAVIFRAVVGDKHF